VFEGNTVPSFGGGLNCNVDSSPNLSNCTFSQNSALRGGALHCFANSSPVLLGCVFTENSAGEKGGAIHSNGSSPTLTDCILAGNQADGDGGGIVSLDSHIQITNCGFLENSALSLGNGGGVYSDGSSSLSVRDSRFMGNTFENSGGGINIAGGGSCNVQDCVFSGNYGIEEAGGAGINVAHDATATIAGCTFSGNMGFIGGGIQCAECSLHIENSIIWNNCANDGNDLRVHGSAWVTLDCCCIDLSGAVGDYSLGPDNIFTSPMFCGPEECETAPTTEGDYHLHVGSPCAPANSPGSCGLIGALPVNCAPAGSLCFFPDIDWQVIPCASGETVFVDITLDGNTAPVETFGFGLIYESSHFGFRYCSKGDLTDDWPGVACLHTRGDDTVHVYGDRGAMDPIPPGSSGSLVRLRFVMNCQGLLYGDSLNVIGAIVNPSYDCSTFTVCEPREWILTDVSQQAFDAPLHVRLTENFPNPFNPGTTIQYDLPSPGGHVSLIIYDVLGRAVRTLVDSEIKAGRYEAYWDGKDNAGRVAPSGIYFFRLETPQGVRQRKAVLLK
jgi:predicted outer membrane repeat protein